jgi:hypothetical protein
MKQPRIAEPKYKKATPIPAARTPIAEGSREETRATGGIIIVGKHIAKMWEANRTTGKK